MSSLIRSMVIILAAGALVAGCGSSPPEGASPAVDLPPVAMAQFTFPGVYSALGTATFTGFPDGVKMMVDVTGIKAGQYAILVLERKDCPPYPLGLPDEVETEALGAGRRVGTLEVADSGHGRVDVFVPQITVAREPDAVVGRTVALFELSESGEPVSRHACGTIRLMPAPASSSSK